MQRGGQRDLDRLTNSLIKAKKELHQTKAENFLIAGIDYELSQNLIQNFQVPIVSDLRRKEGKLSEVVVEGLWKNRIRGREDRIRNR